MPLIIIVMIILFVLFIAIRTVSYAIWSWKQKNKIGGVALIILSIITAAVPIWVSFFIGKPQN